jgi:hypothetical protein
VAYGDHSLGRWRFEKPGVRTNVIKLVLLGIGWHCLGLKVEGETVQIGAIDYVEVYNLC